jgi:branched-subunit amino acid ABC-type transport system permease component
MEQVIVNSLILGMNYALIALGLTLIFAIMNVLNFAHGQMYVLGGFITYYALQVLHLPFAVGLVASVVVLVLVGLLSERLLFRRAIRVSTREESTMLLAAGLALLLESLILLFFWREAAWNAAGLLWCLSGFWCLYSSRASLCICDRPGFTNRFRHVHAVYPPRKGFAGYRTGQGSDSASGR